jgi:hypothetical protein
MKAALPLLALLLLSCAVCMEIQGTTSTAVAAAPNSDMFIWLLQRNIMKGAPYMGLYVNKTAYIFPNFNTIAGISLANAQPTQLYFEIFDLLPVVRGKLDENAYLAKVPPTPTLYLINPNLGTKWLMWNVSHAYLYGIDESKALIVNDEYLNRFYTEYVF